MSSIRCLTVGTVRDSGRYIVIASRTRLESGHLAGSGQTRPVTKSRIYGMRADAYLRTPSMMAQQKWGGGLLELEGSSNVSARQSQVGVRRGGRV